MVLDGRIYAVIGMGAVIASLMRVVCHLWVDMLMIFVKWSVARVLSRGPVVNREVKL